MKFVIVLVCCALAVFKETAAVEVKLPPELADLLKGLSDTCQAEVEIDEATVKDLQGGNLSDDPKVKCYIKCMMRQLQAMTDDGTLDVDLIEATMPDPMKAHGAMDAVRKCKDIHEEDMCETAYKLVACFKKENPEMSILFE